MSHIPAPIRARLEKVLALAKRGVGGEAENAWQMLSRLLAEHGYTIKDLENPLDEKVEQPYKVYAEWQHKLLMQVVISVCALDSQIYQRKGVKETRFVVASRAQHAQIAVAYSVYKNALAKDFEALYTAFIHVNEIFPENLELPEAKDVKLSPERMAELRRAQDLMFGMQKTHIRKQIEG